MSLGIAFKGPEGIVLAADSRVTLKAQIPGQTDTFHASYDNATKLLHIKGQDNVGAVTYGLGAIGSDQPRTAHSFLPEFEEELKDKDEMSSEDFAQALSDFYLKQWKKEMPADWPGGDMIFLVAGYDEGQPYGNLYDPYLYGGMGSGGYGGFGSYYNPYSQYGGSGYNPYSQYGGSGYNPYSQYGGSGYNPYSQYGGYGGYGGIGGYTGFGGGQYGNCGSFGCSPSLYGYSDPYYSGGYGMGFPSYSSGGYGMGYDPYLYGGGGNYSYGGLGGGYYYGG